MKLTNKYLLWGAAAFVFYWYARHPGWRRQAFYGLTGKNL